MTAAYAAVYLAAGLTVASLSVLLQERASRQQGWRLHFPLVVWLSLVVLWPLGLAWLIARLLQVVAGR